MKEAFIIYGVGILLSFFFFPSAGLTQLVEGLTAEQEVSSQAQSAVNAPVDINT